MGFYSLYKNLTNPIEMFENLFDILDGTNTSGDSSNIVTGTKWFNRIAYANDQTSNMFAVFESTSNVDSYLTTDSTQTYYIVFKAFFGQSIDSQQTLLGGETDVPTAAATDFSVAMFIGTNRQITLDSSNPTTVIPTLDPSLVPSYIFDSTQVKKKNIGNTLAITITSRGLAFTISAIENVNQRHSNSFVCIQRPVNPTTGQINIQGTCPIFALIQDCIYRDTHDPDYPNDMNDICMSNYQYNGETGLLGFNGLKFIVVRESDINNSSLALDTYNVVPPSGETYSNYTPGIMYSLSQDWTYPVIFDDSAYVMKYPFGFITSRNTYIDEMDLISFVNSSIYPYFYDIDITVYNETTPRTYETGFGLDILGKFIASEWETASISKARLTLLKSGGGI